MLPMILGISDSIDDLLSFQRHSLSPECIMKPLGRIRHIPCPKVRAGARIESVDIALGPRLLVQSSNAPTAPAGRPGCGHRA